MEVRSVRSESQLGLVGRNDASDVGTFYVGLNGAGCT